MAMPSETVKSTSSCRPRQDSPRERCSFEGSEHRSRAAPAFQDCSGPHVSGGRHEVIAGVGAEHVFGVKMGDEHPHRQGEWPIVGVFSDGGDILESLLRGGCRFGHDDLEEDELRQRAGRLDSAAAFEGFSRWLTTNPGLSVTGASESETGICRWPITVRPSLPPWPIWSGPSWLSARWSVACESCNGCEFPDPGDCDPAGHRLRADSRGGIGGRGMRGLSLCGAAVGAFAAWLFFDGQHSFSRHGNLRSLCVGAAVAVGLGWALLIAVLGGLLPAMRAARLP